MAQLADWLTPLPGAEAMRAVDRWAIEQQGVPGLDLMERAGVGVARAVARRVPDGPVAIVCGKGNNGGDGLVVARLLRETGREVAVICIAPPDALDGDAAENMRRLPGAPPLQLEDSAARDAIARAAVVVDAVLGTGFAGEPRDAAAEAIEAIDRADAPVVAVDVPSGVDASSGVVAGAAVHAVATVTFHAAKPGLWIMPGKAHAGEVETIEIGVPRGAPLDAQIGLISPSVGELLPKRAGDTTKFASGQVVIAGGSRGLTGAPLMASHASMRAGAGYVIACVPASLQNVLAAAATPELMTRGLPEADGSLAPAAAVAGVLEVIRPGGALALGPGLGRSDGAVTFARSLARAAQAPIVLDADGLNAHAGRLAELRGRTEPTVLTPHAGELARLLELDSKQIERERLRHVRAAAEQSGAVVVLKGDDTLIAKPSGEVAVSRGGSPALATAGTGDVLTGVIAALLAQRLDAFTAAAAGVWLHAAAGREAARRQGAAEGVIAGDVIEALPAARAQRGVGE
ncbi:MAG TPA: NAD(P)H-hydrate dehydratase [Solirubrobacteraceae bacterium]|nr:NAD(P)H-hydrate dehydratase [Solirubrobacteraceae bacterium]